MGINPKAWFCSSMNKINGQTRAITSVRRSRRDTGSSVASRLRITMKPGNSSWTVRVQHIAQKPSDIRPPDERRVELSLIRSVAQAGLRRSGSVWGR